MEFRGITAILLDISTEVAQPRPKTNFDRNFHTLSAACHELREILATDDSEDTVQSVISTIPVLLSVISLNVLSSTSTNASACLAYACKTRKIRDQFKNSQTLNMIGDIYRKLILEHKIDFLSNDYCAQTVYSVVYTLRELVNDTEIALQLIALDGFGQCLVKMLRNGTKDMKTCVAGCIGGIAMELRGCQVLYGYGVVKYLLLLLKEEVRVSFSSQSKEFISSLLLSSLGALTMLAKLTGPAEAMIEFGLTGLLEHCLLLDIGSAVTSPDASSIWSRSMNLMFQLSVNHPYIGPYLITEKTVKGWINAAKLSDEPSRFVSLRLMLILVPLIAGEWKVDNSSIAESVLSSSKSIDSLISVNDDDETKAHKFRHRLLREGKIIMEDGDMDSMTISTLECPSEATASEELERYRRRRVESLRKKKCAREEKKSVRYKQDHIRFGLDFFDEKSEEDIQLRQELVNYEYSDDVVCLDMLPIPTRQVIMVELLSLVAQKLGFSDTCSTRERILCCQIFHELFGGECTKIIFVEQKPVELTVWCSEQLVVKNVCDKLLSVCRQDLLIVPAKMISSLLKNDDICVASIRSTNIIGLLQGFIDQKCMRRLFCENNASEWDVLIFDMLLRILLLHPNECLPVIEPWLMRELLMIFDSQRNRFNIEYIPLSIEERENWRLKLAPFQETLRHVFQLRKKSQTTDNEQLHGGFSVTVSNLIISKAVRNSECLQVMENILTTMIRKRCLQCVGLNNSYLDNDSTGRIPSFLAFSVLVDCFMSKQSNDLYNNRNLKTLTNYFEKGSLVYNIASEVPLFMKQYKSRSIDEFLVVESLFTKFIPFRMRKFVDGTQILYEDVVGTLDYENVLSLYDWDSSEPNSTQPCSAVAESEDDKDVTCTNSKEEMMNKRFMLLVRELATLVQDIFPESELGHGNNSVQLINDVPPKTRCVRRWLACKSSLIAIPKVISLGLYLFRQLIKQSTILNKIETTLDERNASISNSSSVSDEMDESESIESASIDYKTTIPEFCYAKVKHSKIGPDVDKDDDSSMEFAFKSTTSLLFSMKNRSDSIGLRNLRLSFNCWRFESQFQVVAASEHEKDLKSRPQPEIIKQRRFQRAKHAAFLERLRASQKLHEAKDF